MTSLSIVAAVSTDTNSSAAGLLVIIGIFALISGAIGFSLGANINRSRTGFWYGAFFGPIGWIVVLLLGPTDAERRRRNQELAETIVTEFARTSQPGPQPSGRQHPKPPSSD